MFISKYGVARHIYIPVIKRNVVDFAVGADWTPAAGDVKISKDGGATANVTNLPVAIAMGNGAIWDFSMTATEMQAAQVVVTVVDSVTKAVEDQSFIIQTHGNASALFQIDLADSVRAGLTALPNAAAGAAGGLDVMGNIRLQKNTAYNNFTFVMFDSTDHVTPKTGLTVTATRSIDGATFAACANAASEIATTSGCYKINLANTDLNGDNVILKFTATGADPVAVSIITQVD